MSMVNGEYQLDKERYDRFLNGDVKGFEELVIEYKNLLIFFLQRYLKDIHLAEDIAQDAFVEVYIHKERYHGKTSFKTYLFTIGRNKAIDYIRKNNRFHEHEILEDHHELVSEDIQLVNQVIQQDNKIQVANAINKMKDEYAKVILLVDFEEFSYKEAAKILNKTTSQIKILLHRARKKLKDILEEEGFTYED